MFIITGKRWFQKTYGNTYHSVSVSIDNKFIGYKPFTYGYGDHYLNTAAEIIGITEMELREGIRNNPGKYHIMAMDVNRKKDL